MIVIGVDVHKLSLTAVAVDQVGRAVAELTVGSSGELVAWSASLGPERLWAVEDCRQLTGVLERQLRAAGESLVRVPPKLMAPERRAGRARGKSDPIDALAVARAALREPQLDQPRPGEAAMRELKLRVDHRDDLVDERRRAQQRLCWQLHDLDPALTVPPGALARTVWLDRVARRLRRSEQTVQIRIARELVGRCRSLTQTILALDRELQARIDAAAPALLTLPGCGALSAAKLLGEIGPIDRFQTDAQLARHAGVAPLEASSGKHRRHRLDRGGNRQLNCALHRIAITQARDYEAWSSSVEHIHTTPGWETSSWPDDRSVVDNLRDLQAHADDFENRAGFTYTVLDPATGDVIGCVYIYPDDSEQHDARVRSWVRASRPELDAQLWRAVTDWLADEWPFERVAYAERADL